MRTRSGSAPPATNIEGGGAAHLDVHDIYRDDSTDPLGDVEVDRGSKENLYMEVEEEENLVHKQTEDTGGTKEKKKKKKLLGRVKTDKRARSDSCDQENSSTGSPPPPAAVASSEGNKGGWKRESKKKKEKRTQSEHDLERELILCKTNCADYANQSEQKSLELKQALQREAFLIREVKEVRQYVSELEAKVSRDTHPYSSPLQFFYCVLVVW